MVPRVEENKLRVGGARVSAGGRVCIERVSHMYICGVKASRSLFVYLVFVRIKLRFVKKFTDPVKFVGRDLGISVY